MRALVFTRHLITCKRHFSLSIRALSKIPEQPTWTVVDQEKYKVDDVDKDLVDHLERLSLVDFGNKEGVERLRDAVHFANQLLDVDTTGVEPMDTVLEDMPLYIRNDEVTEGGSREEILQGAQKTFEGYFVAPPGNIPLKKTDKDYS